MCIFLIFLLFSQTLIPASKLINAWNAGIDVIENENGENVSCLTSNSFADLNKLDVIEYYLHLADLLLLYKTLASVCFSELRFNDNVNITAVTNGIDNTELQFKCAQLIFHIYSPKPGQVRSTLIIYIINVTCTVIFINIIFCINFVTSIINCINETERMNF